MTRKETSREWDALHSPERTIKVRVCSDCLDLDLAKGGLRFVTGCSHRLADQEWVEAALAPTEGAATDRHRRALEQIRSRAQGPREHLRRDVYEIATEALNG